jgi:hypothetical protein
VDINVFLVLLLSCLTSPIALQLFWHLCDPFPCDSEPGWGPFFLLICGQSLACFVMGEPEPERALGEPWGHLWNQLSGGTGPSPG